MKIEEILQVYKENDNLHLLQEALSKKPFLHAKLSGLQGGGLSFCVAAMFSKTNATHLCLLPDKEKASLLFSDLEQIFQEQNIDIQDKKVLFYADDKHQSNKIDYYNNLLRNNVLTKIQCIQPLLIVSYMEAVCETIIDNRDTEKAQLLVKVGEICSMDTVLEQLSDFEFEYADFVVRPGQYTLRGGLIDVFTYAHENPVRIEFDGDKIQSLRLFDIETQLTQQKIEKIIISPDVFSKSGEQQARTDFFALLPKNTIIWVDDIAVCEHEIARCLETEISSVENNNRYIDITYFRRKILDFALLEFGKNAYAASDFELSFQITSQISVNKQFKMLLDNWISYYQAGFLVIFSSANENQSMRMRNIIRDLIETDAQYDIYTAEEKNVFENQMVKYVNFPLHEGFVDQDTKIAFYTDHQVFNRYYRYKIEDKYKKSESLTLKELYDLKEGDYITHIDHGIGQYAGLEKIEIQGKKQEAIKIIYKNNDILYVSIHSLYKIAKYSGKDGVEPTLTRLGSNSWQKIKEKTKTKVKQLVFDLAKLYAERKAAQGFAFSPDNYMQMTLEASFVYEDTPDQLKATKEVKADMEANFPMDRLICGDVGFGKTEIAIRAAFKAVCDSKQVAVLVPTTVLALQHYNTFRDRLANLPCSVDYINRFKSAKQQKETLKALQEGRLDIIIGTHKLLGKDVVFKDLGLLIVDEEQKFGVGSKEKLRTLKVNVDTLTMTATPIPRTLQFSLMGARDISIMRTPPLNRYPIETSVQTFNEQTVFNAVEYELYRGGQVFVVHNRIQNIAEIAALIQNHFPDKRVVVAHGQMNGDVLEKIMMDFIDGYYDVLVSTTIIESGLDIPNANTIIITDAQKYGLSELHQLRGRVGRKNKKAFCYLLTPPRELLSDTAKKRLDAIEEFSDIGSGFNIAMRDLDIRGAGNMLGAEQSGFISEIGYEMYQKILDEAIVEMNQNEVENGNVSLSGDYSFVSDCQIETDMEVLIPDTYVSSSTERLSLYKSLNATTTEEERVAFRNQLQDRFGAIPTETEELILLMNLRQMAIQIGFEKMTLKQGRMIAHFISKQDSPYFESLQFSYILSYLQHHQQKCYMKENGNKLTLTFTKVNSVKEARNILEQLLLPKTEEK